MTRALAARRVAMTYGACALAVAVVTYPIWLFTVGWVWGILISVALGGLVAALLYLRSDAMALKALGTREAAPGEYPRLENLMEGITVAHGFRTPTVHIVDDSAPNAAVLARNPRRGNLVLTTGLLDRLDRVQLEGVLAHELTRIRTGEATLNLAAATVPGLLSSVLPTPGRALAARMLEGNVAVAADLAATDITRYPPGLESAFASIRQDGRVVAANRLPTRHLWVSPPAEAIVTPLFSLDDRIAVLQELEKVTPGEQPVADRAGDRLLRRARSGLRSLVAGPARGEPPGGRGRSPGHRAGRRGPHTGGGSDRGAGADGRPDAAASAQRADRPG